MKALVSISILFFAAVVSAMSASAQSSDQLFPTPVRTNEIVSTIKARDIGDSRLTTYYYTFEGEQGDVFINVQSRNFTGDIDLFVVPGQVPLTKIVIYGDQPETETGRVVYLRKPERLLLRVQGRTPGDDEASIRIKFAGSFAASKLDDSAPPAPTVESISESNVRVNSVGTILEVIPKVKPTPEAVTEKADAQRSDKSDAVQGEDKLSESEVDKTEETKKDAEANAASKEPAKVEVVVDDPVVEEKKAETARTPRRTARRRSAVEQPKAPAKTPEIEKTEAKVEKTPPKTTPSTRRSTARKTQPKSEESEVDESKTDPMANLHLVVYFKDGSTIERPMTEVQRFAVERAVLTIIHKDGTIGRYKMIEVQRISIE